MKEAALKVEGVTVHDLYETYPEFHIDVYKEQKLLRTHDVFVFQHPFYWYSCPPLLKQWLDDVLEFGFAYGPDGVALKGKVMMQAVSTSGTHQMYQRTGHNHFTIPELLRPMEQTAYLCGMIPLKPLLIQGVRSLEDEAFATHARKYASLLEGLVRGDEVEVYSTLEASS